MSSDPKRLANIVILNVSNFFKKINKNCILHGTTCPQTLQQNEVTKRKSMHILEISRLLLIGVCAPKTYWADAVTYAVHLLNYMASRVLSFQTSLAALADHVTLSPSLHLEPKVFCCVAYIYLRKFNEANLTRVQCSVFFLALIPNKKRYRCYHPPGICMLSWT